VRRPKDDGWNNFARVHQEAGLVDHVWTVEEIVGLAHEEDVVILK
jgi:hypothetical protein